MTPQELHRNGYAVNVNYKPIFNATEMINQHINEDVAQYYDRSLKVTRTVLESTRGNILFVGHACSLDGNIRLMGNEPGITDSQFKKFLSLIPYCASSVLKQEGNGWRKTTPIVPGISHSGNRRFDWDKFIACFDNE